MQTETQGRLRTNFVKYGVNETIGNVNEAIQYDELERINVTNTCTDKYKQTSWAYDIVEKENTSSTTKKKKRNVMFLFASMNAAKKLNSTYEYV